MLIPQSIRWRLPISYAAIALLATLSLGVVLLSTLRGFYSRQEGAYLAGNARAISNELASLLQAEVPLAALQSQLDGFAFLSQARVQILNPAGELVLDSAATLPPAGAATVSVQVDVDSGSQAFSQTLSETSDLVTYRSLIVIEAEDSSTRLESTSQQQGAPIAGDVPVETGLVSTLAAAGTPYGFGLGAMPPAAAGRSDRVARWPIFSEVRGEFLGYVELSDGPAYGRDILNSVAWGWAMASLVSIALAALVGWFISRRISDPLTELTAATTRMAGGDLSARASGYRQQELDQLARAFNIMAEQVAQTIESLRRFLTDAAHQLHTPLTALRADLELVASDSQGEQQVRIGRAFGQLDRLESLTSSLLALARLEGSQPDKKRRRLELAQLLRHTSEPYASRAEQADIVFALDLPANETVVWGDESQLDQAVSNLLDNAVKFTSAGGKVTVALVCDSSTATVSVADSGIGVPAADHSHLFERFHRGHNAAAYPGNGLGLAIARAIADSHGGRLWSEPAATGARFCLQLPLAEL